MESIVIFIIIAIISSLLGKKKTTGQKPVRHAQPSKPITENPFKNLGDFAKEIMAEQKQLMETKPSVAKKVPVQTDKQVVKKEREVNRDQGIPRTSGRLSVHQIDKQEQIVSQPNVSDILPRSQDDLVRAIVFSEILAPPKSKR